MLFHLTSSYIEFIVALGKELQDIGKMIASDPVVLGSKKEPEPLSYSKKKYDEDVPFLVKPSEKNNPFLVNQELLNLQMPDHRKAVNPIALANNVETRPESKKGFETNALDHPETSSAGMRKEALNRTTYTNQKDERDEMDDIDDPTPLDNEPFFGPGKF